MSSLISNTDLENFKIKLLKNYFKYFFYKYFFYNQEYFLQAKNLRDWIFWRDFSVFIQAFLTVKIIIIYSWKKIPKENCLNVPFKSIVLFFLGFASFLFAFSHLHPLYFGCWMWGWMPPPTLKYPIISKNHIHIHIQYPKILDVLIFNFLLKNSF